MNFKNFLIIIIALLISIVLIFITPPQEEKNPNKVYRVYLAGKSIGLIKDKDSLNTYIDKEQQVLKDKYQADKVYAPEDLKVVKDITYNEKISTTQEIYNKIKDIEPFTIKGYEITIKGIDTTNEQGEKVKGVDQKIYVLDKQVFEDAMDRTIRSFVNKQMDLDTLKEFGQWLEQEGLQVIATRVSTGGECSIIIEDGYVVGQEHPEPPKKEWKAGTF